MLEINLNSPSSAEGDLTINHVPTQISASSVIIFDSTMNSYLVKLTDIYGRLLVNETITITAQLVKLLVSNRYLKLKQMMKVLLI